MKKEASVIRCRIRCDKEETPYIAEMLKHSLAINAALVTGIQPPEKPQGITPTLTANVNSRKLTNG